MTDANTVNTINAIIAAIAQLSPEQRRRLQRRLRAAGIFEPEDLLTDQRKVEAAPALGMKRRAAALLGPVGRPPDAQHAAQHAAEAPAQPPAQPAPRHGPAPQTLPLKAATPPPRADGSRAPAGGKIVLGAPHPATPADPHLMPPLPGQAPEQPIALVFDGGSKGNPGEGYGSYALRWPGQEPITVRLRFGGGVTNNEAEYDTLISALEAVLKRLHDGGADPATARLDVRGDSLLVVNQVLGVWKVKDERMERRRDRVRALLRRFGHWRLTHHDRENSVRALGH
jgi:ribonuclease HI